MTAAEANALVGHQVINRRTGTIVTVYDVREMRDGNLQVYLSNGSIPPLDAFEQQWKPLIEVPNETPSN